MSDETRMRFLAGIATQLPVERVIEVHLFGAIKQGGAESGVAVIAVDPRLPQPELPDGAPEEAPDDAPDSQPSDSPGVEESDPQVLDFGSLTTHAATARFTVFTARYRHTLKGPDRGKWEMSVTEEADAPLLTVDAVVRGVTRRSGEADETLRLSGDEFRSALSVPARL